jgi:flagellar biosynthesis/type III secretory pathway chaperone
MDNGGDIPALGDLLTQEPSVWLPRLAALLDEQCALCERLETLSASQSAAVAVGDTDTLLRVLGQREAVVDRVTRINAALEPFRAARDRALARLGPAGRDAVVQRVGRIAALVESVRARDDQDRTSLERQRGVVSQELAALSRGRGAAAAYAAGGAGGGAYSGPTFQDRRG